MAEKTRRLMPLYISAVAVSLGFVGHIVCEIQEVPKTLEFYEGFSTGFIVTNILIDWLGRWIFEGLNNFLWFIPTIAFLFQVVWVINYLVKRHAEKKYSAEKSRKVIRKTKKIMFLLSFLPIVLVLIYSFVSIFKGAQTGIINTTTIYGTEAFLQTFVMTCICFCIIPVLPLALVWQVIYIVGIFRNNR